MKQYYVRYIESETGPVRVVGLYATDPVDAIEQFKEWKRQGLSATKYYTRWRESVTRETILLLPN